ncbi:uncharacterized protein LOC132730421 [Ruditapes philippinarum]|uniref:uncharacterized protein LOC132730421 n=1 Tax=Ruditapes philippinarum TaxID=129788 RepID=UPI00295B2CB2|nr:uncharacterized protein LOC132730421 [Ruditapes philippinarum]XP_060572323.1 uncharacterized protein LOC132730421 [Ruditapes philippinarum]XP_060572324.1 uncharacterized protein LOC132730421 [Ruditapes philippinarum]
MKTLSKDYTINVCIILLIFVHAKHVHSGSDDVNTDISPVTRARCLARCLDQFGTVRSTNDDEYPTKNCKDTSCRQCTGPCDLDPFTFDKCGTDLCGGNQYCLSSCSFLKDLHAEALSKHDATQVNHSTILKAPEILCKNVPYGENKCPDLIATVYLRINSYPVNTKLSSVFVISARYINEMNDVTNWTAIKTTAETIVEIPKLRCSTDYQFMVTTVLSDNVYGQSKSTAWSRTPGYNYKPAAPISLSVSEPFLVNQKPSITVTWDPGPEAPCYYKIFWFDQTVLQDEIKVSK